MKARLIWESQTSLRRDIKRSLGPSDAVEANCAGRLDFPLEFPLTFAVGGDEIEIHALEVALDLGLATDRLDAVDGRLLAVEIEERLLFAVRTDHLRVAIVDLTGQVGARAGGHARGNHPPVHHGHLMPAKNKFIGGR